MNSHDDIQPQNQPSLSTNIHQGTLPFIQDQQDLFSFLKRQEKPIKASSFFSKNGLGQDIIQVTGAEPDACLEVFYALYNTLWPQIEKQTDFSLKDAWKRFIGGSVYKGSLCPPEKLISEKRIRDIKRVFSQEGGIFQDLDQVMNSISHLKEKIQDFPNQITQQDEIMASLDFIQEFYLGFRNQVKALVEIILKKEQMNVLYTSESDALEDLLEPKAIMMGDIFAPHWAYRISRSMAQKLLSLDRHGRHLESNVAGPSDYRVTVLPEKDAEPLVYFKANASSPIQPEKEFMIYSLYRHLDIPIPETSLLILTDVFEANPDIFYALLATEAVSEENDMEKRSDFSHEAYASQVFGAFLTNPSDDSSLDFKYSSIYKTLIRIGNELVFKPEITGEDDKKIANVRSILYLLPQMDLPIPESVHTLFTTLDPHLLICAWLQDLSRKNQEYQLLFTRLAFQRTRCIYQNLLPQNEIPSLFTCLQQKVIVDCDLHADSFKPQILASQSLLRSITEKLQLIEKLLGKNRSVSTQIVFEEISPILGKYYRKLRFEFNDPEEVIGAAFGITKTDIDYSYLSSLLDPEDLTSDLVSKNTEPDNEGFLPEAFFKEYKDQVASQEIKPLDKFIQRHNQRKKRNSINLKLVLKELKFMFREDLISCEEIRDIIDFHHSLCKMGDSDLIKEIAFVLSKLPHPELKWLFTLEKYFFRADFSISKDFISSSVPVLGAFMKKRTFILAEPEKRYLFNQQGDIQKNASLSGRSNVTYFPQESPEFYLKQDPEWPGYELASTEFMRLLGVQRLPYHDLIILNSQYPALLSQKVHGQPVVRVWNDCEAFSKLDSLHTGLLIISAMLINPEDGKEDNFILSPDGRYLVPIDGDHCFLPSTFQREEKGFWSRTAISGLQMKTLLFCLDEMYMSIPVEVKKHVLSINFDVLLVKWLTKLDQIENKFNNLAGPDQRKRFLEQGTVMRILFYKQFIHNLYWKANKIQDILRTTEQQITPFDLLKAVEPFAARCYQNSFKQASSLQSRFRVATDNLYKKTAIDGSRVSVLNTRTMIEIVNIPENELVNDAMFHKMGPVDALELLKQLIQERTARAGIEEAPLYELDQKNQEASLKAFLANPKEGLLLKNSQLATSSKLAELLASTPDKGMRIRFLSLPESPVLADKEIRILAEGCPNLEYLNVDGCRKLKEVFTAEGEWPLLGRLEAKDCKSLEKLVSYSPIKILRVGTLKKIELFVEKARIEQSQTKRIRLIFLLEKAKVLKFKL